MRSLPTKMKNKLWGKLIFIWLVITISFSSRTRDMLGMTINHISGSFTKGKEILFRLCFLFERTCLALCCNEFTDFFWFFFVILGRQAHWSQRFACDNLWAPAEIGWNLKQRWEVGRVVFPQMLQGKLATTARCRAWKLLKVEQVCIKARQALHKCFWAENSDSFGWKCACSLSCTQNAALWIWQIEQTKTSAESLGTWGN